MASGKKDAAAEAEAEARKNTERILLVRVEVPSDALDVSKEALDGIRANGAGVVVAWAPILDEKTGEPQVFRGSKKKVIDEYATPEDGDDRPGIYKAPTVTAWKGARPVVLPEKPKAEKLWDESAL
jgi:hypothetical protein